MPTPRSWLILALAAACAGGIAAWADVKPAPDVPKKPAPVVEDQVRRTGFEYYFGNVFGDADTYLKVTRMPVYVLRDGQGTLRDEKDTRALLARMAASVKAAKLTDDDRKQMAGNMIGIFDEADVQFVGASTANITFVVRHRARPDEGDSLCTLVLHKEPAGWRVVEEITDSLPVPPDYLK